VERIARDSTAGVPHPHGDEDDDVYSAVAHRRGTRRHRGARRAVPVRARGGGEHQLRFNRSRVPSTMPQHGWPLAAAAICPASEHDAIHYTPSFGAEAIRPSSGPQPPSTAPDDPQVHRFQQEPLEAVSPRESRGPWVTTRDPTRKNKIRWTMVRGLHLLGFASADWGDSPQKPPSRVGGRFGGPAPRETPANDTATRLVAGQ
jgi:hypothetical protein